MKKPSSAVVLLILVCVLGLGRLVAEQPLSKDDITLLLVGGATSQKLIALVEQRGVDFQINPDLAKRFHDLGASDAVIEAITKAGEKPNKAAPALSPPPSQRGLPPLPRPNALPSQTKLHAGPDPSDPSPERFQEIIQEFARKEKLFKEARNNYTYHQINKVEELDVDGNVVGTYQQDWDILYDDSGKRIERVTYAPVPTLKGLMVTAEDLDSMRNVQPFVLTSDELPEYDVKYLGHVKLDEITTYVFSVRPKELKRGRLYFQGTVWVDDRDLQIVKSDGKTVPETRARKGQFNLFPRFSTYREQIDGKYWFPTYTMADDTLYFPTGPARVKQIIRYTEYKQFKATSRFRIVTEIPTAEPKDQPKSGSPKNSPPKQ